MNTVVVDAERKNQPQDRVCLLTNICIPVIFNDFSQLKMARHNSHLIRKMDRKQSQHVSAQPPTRSAAHAVLKTRVGGSARRSHLKRRLSAVVFGLFLCSPVEQNSCTAFLQQNRIKTIKSRVQPQRQVMAFNPKISSFFDFTVKGRYRVSEAILDSTPAETSGYLVVKSTDVQGSVSGSVVGGRVCPVEEQVLQVLSVPVLTGLSRAGGRADVWKEKDSGSREAAEQEGQERASACSGAPFHPRRLQTSQLPSPGSPTFTTSTYWASPQFLSAVSSSVARLEAGIST